VPLSPNERDTLKKICKAVVVQPVDKSSRERILAATAEVLGRNGRTKLSLSEVATHAGVSRPTLYRWFASKKELLDAFSVWERQSYERTVAEATADLSDDERLDAVLRVIVEYQQSYPGLRMVDIEPAHVIKRLAQILPLMRERLERLISGSDVPRRPRCALRFPTTWCSVTTQTTSWRNCGTPRESATRSRVLEFGEDFVGVRAEQWCG
jgi:AcrR family transcriptional regulator